MIMITWSVLAVAILQCSCLVVNCEEVGDAIPQELSMYNSYEKLLDYFRSSPDPLAKEILVAFLRDCSHPVIRDRGGDTGTRPVIVIEGNHRSSREIISSGLAEIMNARLLIHPAPCLQRFQGRLPKGAWLRRAFYLLSDYAVSIYAKSNSNWPIIINGYWTEKIAFSLGQLYTNGSLPPLTCDVFKWPKDLLKPDFIFYLNFPQRLLPKHIPTKSPIMWKKRLSVIFEYMKPLHPIVVMDIKSLFKLTTEDIHRHVRKHFYDKHYNNVRNNTTT